MPSKKVKEIIKTLKGESTSKRVENLKRFFKTGVGEYAYGQKFLGVPTPFVQKIAKDSVKNNEVILADSVELLKSDIYDIKLCGLNIMKFMYKGALKCKDQKEVEKIYKALMKNLSLVNNWGLVDSSAPYISGPYLFENKKERKILNTLVSSKCQWKRRVAMVSTWYFIKQGEVKPTFVLAKKLIKDKEDLIHKASGWMLREAGKKDKKALTDFLDKNCRVMPRTMLRYSIERLTEKERAKYLSNK